MSFYYDYGDGRLSAHSYLATGPNNLATGHVYLATFPWYLLTASSQTWIEKLDRNTYNLQLKNQYLRYSRYINYKPNYLNTFSDIWLDFKRT